MAVEPNAEGQTIELEIIDQIAEENQEAREALSKQLNVEFHEHVKFIRFDETIIEEGLKENQTDGIDTTEYTDEEPQETKEKEKDHDGEINITDLVEDIVRMAVIMKASDIHIEAYEDFLLVRYRIDGALRDIFIINKHLAAKIIFRIKIASQLRTDEHFAPQDGKIKFVINGLRVDTRVSILPTSKGEKVVMRLLMQSGITFTLPELGFSERDVSAAQKAYAKPYGMILAVGPTGSGKTTTLYSILNILNSRDSNITTVEDPVEYDLPGVNHVQINPKANLTFGSGLRSMLRQDPDVIMVGEIRDTETARIATNAALTGHLVLSTLHTNDSITTIPRLIDMGIERFLVASTLSMIIAQRLARKLCQHCKVEYQLPVEKKAIIKNTRPDIAALIKPDETFYKSEGCDQCGHSGYKGRVGLYEVLPVTKEIRDLISQNANIDQIFKVAREQDLRLITEMGIEKVRMGVTDIDEVLKVTAVKD